MQLCVSVILGDYQQRFWAPSYCSYLKLIALFNITVLQVFCVSAWPQVCMSAIESIIIIIKLLLNQPGTRLHSERKRGKTGSNRKNIGDRSEPSGGPHPFSSPDYLSAGFACQFFFFFAHMIFFSFFSQCGAWFQASS